MVQFTRTLKFRTNDLGKDSVFVLTFDHNKIPGIYNSVFPTALKVTAFGAAGSYKFEFTYKSDLGFTRAQVSAADGRMVPAATYTHISPGEKTILTKVGDPAIYSFSTPQSIQPSSKHVLAQNSADTKENIGLGFFERLDREPTEALLFEGVGAGSSIQFEFTPILATYVISGYQQGSVLRNPIQSPVLFQENLYELEDVTDWLLVYNKGSGVYKITRDFSRSVHI